MFTAVTYGSVPHRYVVGYIISTTAVVHILIADALSLQARPCVTVIAGRCCFHSCLSFCPGVGIRSEGGRV